MTRCCRARGLVIVSRSAGETRVTHVPSPQIASCVTRVPHTPPRRRGGRVPDRYEFPAQPDSGSGQPESRPFMIVVDWWHISSPIHHDHERGGRAGSPGTTSTPSPARPWRGGGGGGAPRWRGGGGGGGGGPGGGGAGWGARERTRGGRGRPR